jgi:PKHD-type hydroxylase
MGRREHPMGREISLVSRNYSWNNIIPKAECELIIEDCKSGYHEIANIGDRSTKVSDSHDYRKTNIYWLDNSKLITKLIYGFVHEANDSFFHYDITNHDQMQFSEYTVGGHYKYHKDTGYYKGEPILPCRKLSVSVLLSDPKDYEGGEFLMYEGDMEPVKPLKGQGSVVVFDSRDYHKVEPVTSGVRYSLVMWATGPLFK